MSDKIFEKEKEKEKEERFIRKQKTEEKNRKKQGLKEV